MAGKEESLAVSHSYRVETVIRKRTRQSSRSNLIQSNRRHLVADCAIGNAASKDEYSPPEQRESLDEYV